MSTAPDTRMFVKYSLFKVRPEWKRLPKEDREDSKTEFCEIIKKFEDKMYWASYSTVGTRGDVDLVIWKVSESIEAINEFMASVNTSSLGGYLDMPHSYFAMTNQSPYVSEHVHEGQEGTSAAMRIIGRKYLFLYPFTKTHDWYQLSFEERQKMMTQHFEVGHKYPNVKISTSYSFGLDDQEFVLGFETDDPGTFLDLVKDLRESKARPYTLFDVPIFSCIYKDIRDCLDDLG